MKVCMFLTEKQVRYLTSNFMPRLRNESIAAMIDVACNGFSILASAQKHKLTHQSLSKNLINLKELQGKIMNAKNLLPSSYLLKENAHALLMAEVSFSESEKILSSMCEKLGGKVELDREKNEYRFYLNENLIIIYLNPTGYEREWSYNHCI